jgi:hypothetical protein
MPESLRLHRWGVAGGIAFALLVVVWVFLTHVPAAVDAPDHVLDVYDEPGVRAQAFAGTLVLAVAGLCFVGFLADLVTVLRKADGSDGPLPTVALSSGICFLVLTLAAGTMFVVLPNLIAFDEVSAQVDPDIASVTVQLGYLLLFIYATVAASGLVIATSVIGLRARLFPRWLGHAGYLLSGLLLLGFSGPPLFLLMLWIAGISIAFRPRT